MFGLGLKYVLCIETILQKEVQEQGYGEDLQRALVILEQLLVTMEQVDSLQYDIKEVKKDVSANPRAGISQEAKLREIERAYDTLKSDCLSKDNELREGIECLEALEDLKTWAEKQRDEEFLFNWAEYHPRDYPYEKVRPHSIISIFSSKELESNQRNKK